MKTIRKELTMKSLLIGLALLIAACGGTTEPTCTEPVPAGNYTQHLTLTDTNCPSEFKNAFDWPFVITEDDELRQCGVHEKHDADAGFGCHMEATEIFTVDVNGLTATGRADIICDDQEWADLYDLANINCWATYTSTFTSEKTSD